ncbi:MAG: fasciclin domain-containing protein [Acidimicrobiia bacterium]
MKKRFSILALLLAFAMIVAACSSDSDDTTTTTEPVMEETSVLDLAIEAGQFSTLIAAIDAAGLGETLEGEGPFTVLAPTDAAFEAAFEALGITAEELLANPALADILTYHVLPQEADSQLVATLDGSSVATVNGQSVDVSVVDGQIMINEATVVSADLVADNGIVHVIDAVLLPPDVAEALGVAMADEMEEETTTTTEATTTTTTEAMDPTIAEIVAGAAAGDPAEFTVLLAALETAGLVDALNGEGPFTVFAPTDAAFGALLEDLGITAEELLANPDLANILLYHVVSGEFLAADVIDLAPVDVPTLFEENTISIAVVDGSVVINDVATVISPDVMASNGVVHIIDAVLVPAS